MKNASVRSTYGMYAKIKCQTTQYARTYDSKIKYVQYIYGTYDKDQTIEHIRPNPITTAKFCEC